ncbi:MAG: undecaprenyldiphospho-muramoylpentapeptide beta-N-acetylglucosaminyltransferase [Muribaculaceae bacterium]|nr:undecaprenyldiphospho-muramoylpentapeptide beta-N-acetylglucosaminyltransferase [Muribaculaceae bacterium]
MPKILLNFMTKVLISGGGTGGHIFPALSIANALRRRDPEIEILFVGADNRMEMERVPAAGYTIKGLPVAGFYRTKIWRNIPVLFKLWKSMRLARSIVREFRPDIAVGVGGYASGPVLKQAQKKGIPTLIQEQNSYAGVTNKLLAKKADAICVAYGSMDRFFPSEKIIMTGNPVRKDILSSEITRQEAKRQLGFDPELPLVVAVGGSLGARTVNNAMKRAVERFSREGVSVLWQTGKLYAEECISVGEGVPNLQVTPFVGRMDLVYRAADLLVSRAGASTISEIQLVGIPSVLIPSPNVAEDHQRKNALALVARDAAVMIEDSEAEDKLGDVVMELLGDPARLKTIGGNAAEMALPDADEKIVDKIFEIIGK